jgi:hypothetical protein
MKKPIYYLSALAMITVICLSTAFKSTTAKVSFQYITIIAQNHDLDEVSISIDGKEFVHTKLHKEAKGHWDMNPILNIVHQYENDGYELESFTGTGIYHYFLLKKVKQ